MQSDITLGTDRGGSSSLRNLHRGAREAVAASMRIGLDALLPPRCPESGALIAGRVGLAADFWRRLHFLAGPCCWRCGLSFDIDLPQDTVCAACEARPPQFDRARSVLAYDDESRPLLLNLKHGDRTDLAPLFGTWLGRTGADLLSEADLIAPVPMHRTRLLGRRYNQAALLTKAITRPMTQPSQWQVDGPTVVLDLLARRRATPSQGKLSPLARARNVRGAFAVRPRYQSAVLGKRIVLIDDVFTTGATVEECARVLRRAGAGEIDVLTLARVMRPRH